MVIMFTMIWATAIWGALATYTTPTSIRWLPKDVGQFLRGGTGLLAQPRGAVDWKIARAQRSYGKQFVCSFRMNPAAFPN